MKYSRAPKLIGDFGEGLITYLLIRKGFEVANVDHVGADLIAERNGERWAVSVKTRLFRKGTTEARMMPIEYSHLEKLNAFARRFGMQPVFAQVISVVDDKIIHTFVFKVASLKLVLRERKNGYNLNFGRKYFKALSENPLVEYSCWQETLSDNVFRNRDT